MLIPAADAAWVRYKAFTESTPLGKQRQAAVALARGRIAVLWSEYDLYSSDRIETQVQSLIDGSAKGALAASPRSVCPSSPR